MKKRLYLASSIDRTAAVIAGDISKDPRKLRLAFISTAAEVEEGDLSWLKDDRNGLIQAGFNLFEYTLTGKTDKDLEKDLGNVDVVHVNGGNTFYLLMQARESGFDKWVKRAVDSGKIYTGSSAGSIIASPNIEISRTIETKIFEEELRNFRGFNLVDFIIFPHWGSDFFKDLYLGSRLKSAYKPKNKIILLNDWQYVKVENDFYKIVDIRN